MKFVSKQDKKVMADKLAAVAGVSFDDAFSYLEAEEWCFFEALGSLRADTRAGLR